MAERIIGVCFWLVALLAGCPEAAAQKVVLSIEQEAISASLDPFGNLYILTPQLELIKYNSLGSREASHTDLELSDRSDLSSDHAFKFMIYYPEFEMIRVFGNKLQELAVLDLVPFGLGEVTAVAPSSGYQSFWIFNATSQKLVRIEQSLGVADPGNDLLPVIGEPIFPVMIKEREGWLFVCDPDKGFYFFDNYGTFSHRAEITGATSFSVLGDHLFAVTPNGLFQVEIETGTTAKMQVPSDGRVIGMNFRKMIVQEEDRISVYEF